MKLEENIFTTGVDDILPIEHLQTIDQSSSAAQFFEIDQLVDQPSTNSFSLEQIININTKSDIIFLSADIDENILNKKRTLQLEKDFTHELLFYLCEDEFEYGFVNRADLLIKNQIKINCLATKEWLNKLFVSYFNNSSVIIGILRLIARIDLDEIFPEGKIMAIAALSHKNLEVQECGIRAFESWGNLDSINILNNVKVKSQWLQDYLEKVIDNIEKEYAIVS